MAMLETEQQTIGRIQAHWKRRYGETYVALEEVNFMWSTHEVNDFIRLWEADVSLRGLQKRFRRSQNDIAVLILDLAQNGRIKPRAKGLGI